MKAALFMLLLAAPAHGSRLLRSHQSPDEVKLDMEYRQEDSFGKTELAPSCSKITCGEYSCPTPFELKVDGTCCGYCYAPDHEIGVDRHQVTSHNATGLVVDQCEGAPSTCKGPGVNVVRCFRPSCREGDAPHCAAGACCAACTAR
mmetsp:Transcript_111996/g.300554  ORF Transcript_111996/g.300554 Transcript_111996/m.300554 type:complete len:146 (-) Transcript_111996:45-482(-)